MKSIEQWLLKYSDYYVMAIALICLYAIFQIKFNFAFWMGYSEKADAWNEIITNLSYSYLAGFIFYLLTVTLPHKKMKGKVKVALDSKLNMIRSNYKACVESVYHPLKAMSLDITKDEAIANFKEVSFYQKCKMGYFQDKDISVVDYIRLKHQENVIRAAELLEYKPWLSSETAAQIEEIRNSNLPAVIISLTQSIGKDQLDNEDGRGMLAGEMYDLWTLAKNIKF
jgi:hypothetical protein